MPSAATIIRKVERFDVSIHAHIGPVAAHAGVVRLAASAGARDGMIECNCVDISLAGAGFFTNVFLPRLTRIRVRLMSAGDNPTEVLGCDAVVRRCIMTDRRPAYHVGVAFADLSEEQQRQLDVILSQVGQNDASI
ncbi:MAG TPA: PilZ domain-containing protein [Phycisphaerales bacterium]|nr:PilZ domain-containing protein [Phycisphaerales bacterium]